MHKSLPSIGPFEQQQQRKKKKTSILLLFYVGFVFHFDFFFGRMYFSILLFFNFFLFVCWTFWYFSLPPLTWLLCYVCFHFEALFANLWRVIAHLYANA